MYKKLKVIFVDNKEITNSLSLYVNQNINWLEVTGELENKSENIDYILTLNSDILICNSICPILTNIMDIEKIKKIQNHTSIFILSGNNDYNSINTYHNFKIKKYITKPKPINDIFNLIKKEIKG